MVRHMEKLVVANWKASLTLARAEKWLTEFQAGYRPVSGLRVVLAVPSLFLLDLRNKFGSPAGVSWAAQDVSSFPLGSYTGSVPAAWLAGLADHVIVGHGERRRYFHETIQDVANKVSEALDEDVRPILCVDMETARQQAASLDMKNIERLIVAYTPGDAEQLEIARGRTSLTDEVLRISGLFPGAPVLYGGGVNEKNVADLMKIRELAGVMAARGCLEPGSFVKLLGNAATALGL